MSAALIGGLAIVTILAVLAAAIWLILLWVAEVLDDTRGAWLFKHRRTQTVVWASLLIVATGLGIGSGFFASLTGPHGPIVCDVSEGHTWVSGGTVRQDWDCKPSSEWPAPNFPIIIVT